MRRISFLVIGVLVAMATITGLFYACERNEPEGIVADNSQNLQFSKNVDFGNLSKNDLGILSKGIHRIIVSGVSRDYLLNKADAKEFNMSQEMFDMCLSSLGNYRRTGFRKRFKANGETGGNDCVAKSISYCIDQMRPGESTSFYTIQYYCQNRYGMGGVPLENVSEVMKVFTDYETVKSSDLKFGDMIITNNNDGDGHAAIFMTKEGNEIHFYNPRTPEKPAGHCPASDLIEAFRVTGFKNL